MAEVGEDAARKARLFVIEQALVDALIAQDEQAGAEEEMIITDKMLKAGAEQLYAFSTFFESEEGWAKRVYVAMVRAARRDIAPFTSNRRTPLSEEPR